MEVWHAAQLEAKRRSTWIARSLCTTRIVFRRGGLHGSLEALRVDIDDSVFVFGNMVGFERNVAGAFESWSLDFLM